MIRFIDDLAGALYDLFKFIITSVFYLLAGAVIVTVPIYMFVWVLELFQ